MKLRRARWPSCARCPNWQAAHNTKALKEECAALSGWIFQGKKRLFLFVWFVVRWSGSRCGYLKLRGSPGIGFAANLFPNESVLTPNKIEIFIRLHPSTRLIMKSQIYISKHVDWKVTLRIQKLPNVLQNFGVRRRSGARTAAKKSPQHHAHVIPWESPA